MDIAEATQGQNKVVDEVALRSQKLFYDFLQEFKEGGELKYVELIREFVDPDKNTFEISFDDIEKFNQNLAQIIIEEYYRLHPYLCKAVTKFIKERGEKDLIDDERKNDDFFVSFVDVPTRHKIRELTTTKIGTLIRISGQVVRTHPVHPELVSGTFVCMECQTVIKDVEQQFKFTNPTICRNPVCNNRRKFMLDMDQSKFVDFQKVRIQETQAELPRGCIPRSVEVVLRGDIVETVQAGDRYDFTGTLIVVPDVGSISLPGAQAETGSRHKRGDDVGEGVRGLKSLGIRDLNYRMAFLACSVQNTSAKFGGCLDMPTEESPEEYMKKHMTETEWNKIYEMSKDKSLYQNLINSLFPSIYGNEEIKRGLILMLFGGVAKTTIEGTSLRGDINCCIVGDPSTAKSQFLKQVLQFSPRAVYTSGKASTAAGLTAAVVRDEESSDFVIEAGALMLADNGICCIDEFDKMDPRDQVAIHEAMEQQTISIAKASIRATLNARTSILAAANPIGGRYDRTKSLQQNIALSAPIMSRFDLFFVVIDESNEIVDYSIARKIIDLHSQQDDMDRPYTQEEVLRYIMFARQFKPVLTQEALELLVEKYHALRQRDLCTSVRSTWRVTVRQLESMIRLSEAMARMECNDFVNIKHVKEAYRLLNKSIIRVEQPDIHLDDGEDLNEMEVEEQNGDDVNEETTNSNGKKSQKKKLTLTYQDYKMITNSLIVYMRNEEAKLESEGSDKEGIRKSDVVAWYLEFVSEQIESEEELMERKALIERLLDRLIYHDQVIIPLTTTQLKKSETQEDEDPLLVVHPNYVLD